jgi:hypothetical protein
MTILHLKNGPERDEAILAAIKAGQFAVSWVPLAVTEKGPGGEHTAQFQVTADALKLIDVILPIDKTEASAVFKKATSTAMKDFASKVLAGQDPNALPFPRIRVNVSAALLQKIADALGASMLTPKLADELYIKSAVVIPPSPQAISSDTWAMVDHSLRVDEQLKNAGGRPSESTISTVGKDWVLSNKLRGTSKAMNYGWHFKGKTFGGQAYEPSATVPGLRVVQGQGTAHNSLHSDYSQVARLVKNEASVDGVDTTIQAILQDPSTSHLASHEGVLSVLRQPGVPLANAFGNEPAWIEKAPFGVGVGVGSVLGFAMGGPAGSVIGMGVGFAVDWIRKYKL